MGQAAEEAKKYLQEKDIPPIFESLMTGLMYNKPENAIDFMMAALNVIKQNPEKKIVWDMFMETPPPSLVNAELPPAPPPAAKKPLAKKGSRQLSGGKNNESARKTPPPAPAPAPPSAPAPAPPMGRGLSADRLSTPMRNLRTTEIPGIPIVVIFGGPGGAKTKYAAQIADKFKGEGVVHISTPEIITKAMDKYGSKYKEWKQAQENYTKGHLLPDEIILALVKAEMAKSPKAAVYLIDGYPRTMAQVMDLEKEGGNVQCAIIIDFDEETLKQQTKDKGKSSALARNRLEEFKAKTLPAAKYYDDKFMLHLIPGEQAENLILDELKKRIDAVLRPELAVAQKPQRGLDKDVPVILVTGAPGSMKAEYCKRIVKRYDGFVHIPMGELLRTKAELNKETNMWSKVMDTMNRGDLLPKDVCEDVVWEAIQAYPASWGYVIEGFPRDLEQAKSFENDIARIDVVLLIDCTEQYCMKTLKARAENDSLRRKDDTPEATKQRISMFKQRTLPMLKYFDEKGKLKVIEGDKGIDGVFQDVVNILDAALFIPQDSPNDNLGKSLSDSR